MESTLNRRSSFITELLAMRIPGVIGSKQRQRSEFAHFHIHAQVMEQVIAIQAEELSVSTPI